MHIMRLLSAGAENAGMQDGLNPRDALDILEIRQRDAQSDLAQRTDAGDAVLQYLAQHGAPATRAAVAANPAAPALANRVLADDAEEDVRAELAGKIARLMPGLALRETEQIVALTIETLECLARDSAVRVRAILADEIKHLDCVPQSVIQTLARDLEDAVAMPILEYSPLLSDSDLIEIIACGQVRQVLTAIARRSPLSEDVSDVLVQSLDVPAIAALLVNPDAKLRAETLDRIIKEAEEIQSWHVPLALRADLSARAVRRIGGFVGAGMLERLADRAGLSDSTRAFLNRQLRARLEHRQDDEAMAQAATAAVHRAATENRLSDAFVEDAAMANNREAVIQALATLGKVPEPTVRRILSSGSAKPLIALVWHAGLTMRAAFRIQTFVMKLPGRELLPARGGVGFPLKPDEMRWHLNYFDISC